MNCPWQSNRELSDDLARELIETQFPHLAPVAITRRASGWDNEALEIGGEWIFRFPKQLEFGHFLEREIALLARLEGRFALEIPRYEHEGRATPAFPCAFAGYRKLDGVFANRAQCAFSPALARQLGEFLRGLHSIPSPEISDLGLPFETANPDDFLPETLVELEAVGAHLPPKTVTACREFLAAARGAFEGDFAEVLLHNDLRDEHLLLGENGAQIRGLIDWTDAAWGDSARDFAGIWVWGGAAFCREVFDFYGLARDPHFWTRVAFYGVCNAVSTLYYLWETGENRGAQREKSLLLRALDGC